MPPDKTIKWDQYQQERIGGRDKDEPDRDFESEEEAPPSPKQEKPERDWERSYKGLQGHASKLQAKISEMQQQLDALTSDYEGRLSAVTTERDTERTQRTALEADKTRFQQDALRLQKQLSLHNMVHDPQKPELAVLAPFLAKGLLAVGDLEGEQLEKYLKDYADTLGSQLEGKVKTAVAGASPTAPSGARSSAGQTADELYEQLMAASPTDQNYSVLMAAYQEQLKREQK